MGSDFKISSQYSDQKSPQNDNNPIISQNNQHHIESGRQVLKEINQNPTISPSQNNVFFLNIKKLDYGPKYGLL